MTLDSLRTHLEQRFNPQAAGGLDAVFRLAIGPDELLFRVRDGQIEMDVEPDVAADATFMFADHETAWSLLAGSGNAFEAFMQGRFRSDGYLMWAFALMAMFDSPSLPVTPTE